MNNCFKITITWDPHNKEFSINCPNDMVITLGMLEYALLTQKKRDQISMTVRNNIDVVKDRIKEIENDD